MSDNTHEVDGKSIPRFFKELRKSMNMNQDELSKILDIDRTYLSRIENGHVEPSVRLIRAAEYACAKHAKNVRFSHTPTIIKRPPIKPSLELPADSKHYYDSLTSKCLTHIIEYTDRCYGFRPERIAWLLEELRDKFPLDYFDKQTKSTDDEE